MVCFDMRELLLLWLAGSPPTFFVVRDARIINHRFSAWDSLLCTCRVVNGRKHWTPGGPWWLCKEEEKGEDQKSLIVRVSLQTPCEPLFGVITGSRAAALRCSVFKDIVASLYRHQYCLYNSDIQAFCNCNYSAHHLVSNKQKKK